MAHKIPAEVRFWPKVNKNGPTQLHMDTPCWLWLTGKFPSGYGAFAINRVNRPAHRIAWELVNGPIPEGLDLLHRCDVRACVRPDHLFPGTHQENMADMIQKERQARGSKAGNSKLTEAQVVEVFKLHRVGWTGRKISKKFNVTAALISFILRGKGWKHVGETLTPTHKILFHKNSIHHGSSHGCSILNEKMVRQIRKEYAAGGVTHQQLADRYKVDRSTVSDLLRRKTWDHI